MTTQRKITLTFLDLDTANTIGWSLRYFARQLGLWADRTDIEVHNLLQNGLDTTKFQLSTVWHNGVKTARVFATGYSISDQLDSAMESLAYSGNDNVEVEFSKLVDRVKYRFRLDGQDDRDFWRTIVANLNPKWLDTVQDKDYLTEFNNDKEAQRLPLLPSAQSKAFRSDFDTNMVVPKTLIE